MKLLSLVVLILLSALPAHAQNHATQVSSAPAAASMGGGAGGAGGGYGSSFSFTTSSTSAPVHYQYTYAQGTDSGFIPSTYVRFEDALKIALAPPPKPVSIAEVAAEYRALKQHTN
jgi:hypothetical protein